MGVGGSLWEQAKDLCLCLFRWHHLSTIPYIRYPAVLSTSPHFLLTQHWVSDWLEISLKLHPSECKPLSFYEASPGAQNVIVPKVILQFRYTFISFLRKYSVRGDITSHAGLLMHQKKEDLLLPSLRFASPSHKWQTPWFALVVVSKKSSLEQVAHESMRAKFLFNFLTGHEKKKPNLTVLPNTPTFQQTANVKLIISSRNENELHCRIIKVTDIMFLHTATWPALFKNNYRMEKGEKGAN